jgi:hypothetical protein
MVTIFISVKKAKQELLFYEYNLLVGYLKQADLYLT